MQQDNKYCEFRRKKSYKPFYGSLLTYCRFVCSKTNDDCDPECYKKVKELKDDKIRRA